MADGAAQLSANLSTLEREFEIIAHNMANVSTTGFKRRCNSFTQAMEAQAGPSNGTGDGSSQSVFDFSQGTLVQTDRTLDLALYGKGFFVLESPEGPLYTRHGVFQTNENGQIVDTAGRLVAGTSGPVIVPPNVDVSEIQVDDSGRVSAGTVPLGQLRVVEFGDREDQLLPYGLNCFRTPKDVEPRDAPGVVVRQGYTEASNVKLIDELVNMITVSRLYQATMKLATARKDNTTSAIDVAMG
ncbi:MAG: flagellar hook basal-body protein [Planctomycetes bacterium]|nr:flagellar hook basal-body protein [Planctomycetota bacterium]